MAYQWHHVGRVRDLERTVNEAVQFRSGFCHHPNDALALVEVKDPQGLGAILSCSIGWNGRGLGRARGKIVALIGRRRGKDFPLSSCAYPRSPCTLLGRTASYPRFIVRPAVG